MSTLHFLSFKLHPATLHYTFRHFTSSHLNFTQLHFTPFHYTFRHFTSSHLNFIQLHFTTLSFGLTPSQFPTTPFHLTSLHFTSNIKKYVHFTLKLHLKLNYAYILSFQAVLFYMWSVIFLYDWISILTHCKIERPKLAWRWCSRAGMQFDLFWLDMARQCYGEHAMWHERLVPGVFTVEYIVSVCLCYLRILTVIWIIPPQPFKSQRSLYLDIYHQGLLTYLLRRTESFLTLQRGVTGTARMLHALTHSSISRQVMEQM